MQISENVSLAPYTTFYIGGLSRYLIYAQDTEEIIQAVGFAKDKQLPLLFFGGGSNILVADQGFKGVAVRIESVGIDIVADDDKSIILQVASGEVWDDVVRFACEEGWWGIENLSHIPGFTGALTVQNVGAYGQEASEVVETVEVLDLQDQQIKVLTNEQLQFSYRHSIFNTTHKNRYVIISTNIKLTKLPQPNLSYGDLSSRFGEKQPDLMQIRKAIIEIRDTKFPFPNEPTKGNSGSFFRGPILTAEEFNQLQNKVEKIFGTELGRRLNSMRNRLEVAQGYKTPTAFLIEISVKKNSQVGGAALNPVQPAIIINQTGQASADDVLTLFKQVQARVRDKTGVTLEAEPELIGFNEAEISGLKY